MPIFLLLLVKLLPLYAMIGLGVFAGKRLKVDRESIGRIVFYFLIPVLVFSGVIKAKPTMATLFLPVLTFALSSVFCLVFLKIYRRIWPDARANILAMAAGTANTGYFGLPVAMAIFDEQTVGLYIVGLLGMTLYESSLGFFVAAKGKHTAEEALRKVARLPTLYAFLVGLAVYWSGIALPEIVWEFASTLRGAYVFLGMMIIGLGLAGMKRLALDWHFIALAFLPKLVLWPLAVIFLVFLDNHFLHFYAENIHHSLLLLSIMPMAANTVVIATILDAEPEKAATAVFLSTVLAIITVPLMTALLISH